MANVVRVKPSVTSTTTADNAAATVTIADQNNASHFITGISASFSTAQTAAKLMTLKDGANTIGNYHVFDNRDIVFSSPIQVNGVAEVSLPASGTAGQIGAVTVHYYTL